jgi:glycolate oxidase FAD binding subunit
MIELGAELNYEQLPTSWLDKIQLSPSSKAIAEVIYPETTAQLAASVALANQKNCNLVACGQGSKLNWGGLIDSRSPLVLVSTQRLNQLVEHAAGDLTVTVEAGMPYLQLQAILAKSGQFLAVDPPFAETATIGGIIATGSSGSWRQRYLSVRDMCLGISFVRADGQSVKGGGRVVKNVAGYDLMKLLTGSYGSLGIITQATFRLYPLPEVTSTLIFSGNSDAIAALLRKILQSNLTPSKLDLISGKLLETIGVKTDYALLVDFASIAASVEIQSQQAIALSNNLNNSLNIGLNLKTESTDTNIWQQISNYIWHSEVRFEDQNLSRIAKVGILPTKISSTLDQIQKIIPVSAQIHGGSGLGWIVFESSISAAEFLQIRQLISANGGFLSLIKAPISLKHEISDLWDYGKDTALLMQQLKQKFDPQAILSPGRI